MLIAIIRHGSFLWPGHTELTKILYESDFLSDKFGLCSECRGGHTAPIYFPSKILLPILMGYQAICYQYWTELYINNIQI